MGWLHSWSPADFILENSALQDTAVLSTQGPAVWLNYWTQLAQGLAQNAITANQVIIDGVNEPEIAGVRWEPSSGGNAAAAVGYGALLLQLWDAVNPILPNALLFFEGTSQYSSQGEWGRPGILGPITAAAVGDCPTPSCASSACCSADPRVGHTLLADCRHTVPWSAVQ